MRIITYTCPNCGTVVSANELERERVMKCPGLHCDTTISFEDLPEAAVEFYLSNREQYRL